jgi:hypothetical protein
MIIEIILASVIVLQAALHFIERRDLYNRIMSKSLNEYKDKGAKVMSAKSAHDRVIARWRGKDGDK